MAADLTGGNGADNVAAVDGLDTFRQGVSGAADGVDVEDHDVSLQVQRFRGAKVQSGTGSTLHLCTCVPLHLRTFLTGRSRCHYRVRHMPIEQRQPQGLVDILDKILDKGLVVAGDIKVSLANVELLTIQLRLVICSIDKAEAIGINWWRSDRFYSSGPDAVTAAEYAALSSRVAQLEEQLSQKALSAKAERKGR